MIGHALTDHVSFKSAISHGVLWEADSKADVGISVNCWCLLGFTLFIPSLLEKEKRLGHCFHGVAEVSFWGSHCLFHML